MFPLVALYAASVRAMNLWLDTSVDTRLAAALIRQKTWQPCQANADHHKRIYLSYSPSGGGLAAHRTLCELTLVAALLISGCVTDDAPPAVLRDDVLLYVHLVDHIDYRSDTKAYGLTRCANNVCTLEILRDSYPYCLQHELRHAFEGNWHANRETLEDC